jgi:hypothetical protein
MLEAGEHIDFAEKPFRADGVRNLCLENLDGDVAFVPSVSGEKNVGAATGAQLLQDVVATRELGARDTGWGSEAIGHMARITVLPGCEPGESFHRAIAGSMLCSPVGPSVSSTHTERRNMTVGKWLPRILLAALVLSGALIGCAVYEIHGAVPGSPVATQWQGLATYVFVPIFQASLAALLTGGVIKALFTTIHNASVPAENKLAIKFFDW